MTTLLLANTNLEVMSECSNSIILCKNQICCSTLNCATLRSASKCTVLSVFYTESHLKIQIRSTERAKLLGRNTVIII